MTSLSGSARSFGGILVAAQQTPRDNIDTLILTCPDLGRLSASPAQPGTLGGGNAPYATDQLSQFTSYNPQPSISPSRPALVEQAHAFSIEGRTWAIAEVPHPLSTLPCSASYKVPGRGELRLNELAAQTSVQPRSLLVLTSEGMHVIEKQRPVDILKGILEAGATVGREGEIAAFFNRYRRSFL